MAESRLRSDAERAEAELVADRTDGPYAGVHRLPALEFLARWVVWPMYAVATVALGKYNSI